jgi:hypothetical protein
MQFTRPIANLATTFYMYFIRDTLIENGEKIVKLYFTPRNPEDLLFRGYLYITLNDRYAVSRVELGVSKHVNLNYIRNFQINQQFKQDSSAHYYLAESVTSAFSAPTKSRTFGERGPRFSTLYSDHIQDRCGQSAGVPASLVYSGNNRPLPPGVRNRKPILMQTVY